MWNRKELKRRSRGIVKRRYWSVIAICFITAFLMGSRNDTFSAVFSYDSSKEILNVVQENTVFDINDIRSEKPLDRILEKYEKKHQEEEEIIKNSPYTRGVFSSIYNRTMAMGSVFSGIIALILTPVFEGAWLSLISAAVGAALLFFWWLYIRNIIRVGSCRFFLEADTYRETGGNRIFYLYKIRRVRKAARIMFRKALYQWLWSLTIVGGWIKGYSYMMVPYLAAENPDIGSGEAIAVSRRMMKGNKWRSFLLDVSFLGWNLLSLMTFGIINIFYANPYKAGTKAELYLALRKRALEEGADYCSVFRDKYLTSPPGEEELREALTRAAKLSDRPDWKSQVKTAEEETPDVFREYPMVLSALEESGIHYRSSINYNCKYGITGIVLLFFLFSIVGWGWETALHLIQSGELVNRGVLHGPWLPIYGSGGVLVLLLLKKFRDRPVLTFFLTVAVCGGIEYMTSWYLEQLYGVRWWDYSGYFLNLDGRVCAEGLLVFGLGGCLFIYILAPTIMEHVIRKIPMKWRVGLCLLLAAVFAADFFYSRGTPNVGQGITGFAPGVFDQTGLAFMMVRWRALC